uniref:Uncharacterized protein n=1 Tax=Arion vulgaris TaxID=1028688 RepID=A0A0B6ZRY3_9EUPU
MLIIYTQPGVLSTQISSYYYHVFSCPDICFEIANRSHFSLGQQTSCTQVAKVHENRCATETLCH